MHGQMSVSSPVVVAIMAVDVGSHQCRATALAKVVSIVTPRDGFLHHVHLHGAAGKKKIHVRVGSKSNLKMHEHIQFVNRSPKKKSN